MNCGKTTLQKGKRGKRNRYLRLQMPCLFAEEDQPKSGPKEDVSQQGKTLFSKQQLSLASHCKLEPTCMVLHSRIKLSVSMKTPTCIFKDYLIDMKNKCREMLRNCRKNSYHFNVKFFDIWTFCFLRRYIGIVILRKYILKNIINFENIFILSCTFKPNKTQMIYSLDRICIGLVYNSSERTVLPETYKSIQSNTNIREV